MTTSAESAIVDTMGQDFTPAVVNHKIVKEIVHRGQSWVLLERLVAHSGVGKQPSAASPQSKAHCRISLLQSLLQRQIS